MADLIHIPEDHPDFKVSDTPLEDLPRATAPNPCNYTPEQLAQNKVWLAQLKLIHPGVHEYFLNLCIDYYNREGAEKVDEIMASGVWE